MSDQEINEIVAMSRPTPDQGIKSGKILSVWNLVFMSFVYFQLLSKTIHEHTFGICLYGVLFGLSLVCVFTQFHIINTWKKHKILLADLDKQKEEHLANA